MLLVTLKAVVTVSKPSEHRYSGYEKLIGDEGTSLLMKMFR